MTVDVKALRAAGDAGEIVDAVLRECGIADGVDARPTVYAAWVPNAIALVQRALDAAEERGAEGEREQRADHRAADRDVYGAVRR